MKKIKRSTNPKIKKMIRKQNKSSVRVRFAPSPTGYLHIGSIRTALFNYLFAKHNDGKFLLRIEDTDTERSSKKMIENILESLKWLGLNYDEKIVYQSDNIEKHKQAADKLLEEGKAYRCFCTKEELQKDKLKTASENRYYKYSGRCRSLTDEQIKKKLEKGEIFSIRFKTPEGITKFKDRVYKSISVNNSEIDDFIIVRSDGSPTYNFAVVVDDSDMEITHVIRGEDHLSNTPKQILIYLALNRSVPKFAHVPLITDPEKKRLSKRTGAVSVEEYRKMGFTQEGLINGLVHLGWGTGQNKTIFTIKELIKNFELNHVSKKRAVFDYEKIKWINGKYISSMSAKKLFPLVVENWKKNSLITDEKIISNKKRLLAIIDLLKSRMRLIPDFSILGKYFFKSPQKYEEDAVQKHWTKEKVEFLLERLIIEYTNTKDFNLKTSEEIVRRITFENKVKAGVLIHALRLAITGFSISPNIFDVLILVGKQEVIQRIKSSLKYGEENGIFI